jgi:putative addiction module component (TIGR02574 family)
MDTLPVAEILELPVAERLRLLELIWDSIAQLPEAVSLSDELRTELEDCLAEFEANPEGGLPWDEVRESVASAISPLPFAPPGRNSRPDTAFRRKPQR